MGFRSGLLILTLLLVPFILQAQNENDVLRYSRSELHGTARSTGMAGAFGALGADHTAIGSNPAGIALFRKSEISFTPAFGENRASADFAGELSSEDRFDLAVDEFGLSFISMLDQTEWESLHFGFSYQKLRSFDERIRIRSQNADRSILDYFTRISDGTHLSQLPQQAPFTGEMAYQTYLMDPEQPDSTSYTHHLEGDEFDQEKRIQRSGGMNELRFSFGADRSNKLYLGATIGIPLVSFERTTIHKEDGTSKESDVEELRYTEELTVNGGGLNLQLGAIARPSESFRFGLAYKTPSLLSLTDEWTTLMSADHNDSHDGLSSFETDPLNGNHDYRIQTPSRLNASMAYFIEKLGVVSAEYIFRDPSNGKLMPTLENEDGGYDYAPENILVKDRFKARHEFRIGTEWRIFHPILIRAGYRLNTSPVRPRDGVEEGLAQDLTIGAGYREGGYYLDFSFQRGSNSELHRPADPEKGQSARIDHRRWAVRISGGVRF